jgi:hypothetical protein
VNLAASLWNGLRTVALRPPRDDAAGAGPGLFLALVLVYLGVSIAIAMVDVPRPWQPVPYGVTTVLTDALLTLAAAWLLTRVMQREGIVWDAACVLLAATIATSAVVHWPLSHGANALAARGHFVPALLLDIASRWWWLLVLLVVANWLAPRHLARVVLAAVLGYAVSAAAWWWLPAMPVLATSTDAAAVGVADASAQDDSTDTDDDEGSDEPDFDAEEVFYNQPALLDAALAGLKPQTPGKVDLYVVALAADAEEDVFRNEVEYADTLFKQRFGAEGRVLVLENNRASLATRPLATLTNLTHALDRIAKIMDPSEDVLLLYLTTHGSEDHDLLVDLDPLPLNQIAPEDLADALQTSPGIRWKVIVVNACYSGGFVDALHDDSTMVITSARSDRTSFGCGASSDITYFGKAFLAEALNQTTSIREAFDLAKGSVKKWEDEDKEEHSEPQIASTQSIEAKLESWRRTVRPGAPVVFAPADAAQ